MIWKTSKSFKNVTFGKIGIIQKLLCDFEFTSTGDVSLRLRRLRNAAAYIIFDHGMDSIEKGVIEPTVVKVQAIKSAAESAAMIMRIDDVISASKSKGGPGGP